mmetsp:Transcript_56046/g.65471  ORF Transcript_56046/g.65471 Transcript_56046/m.65471 type:complete len:102 (-) Transcript_56046:51-356(-)
MGLNRPTSFLPRNWVTSIDLSSPILTGRKYIPTGVRVLSACIAQGNECRTDPPKDPLFDFEFNNFIPSFDVVSVDIMEQLMLFGSFEGVESTVMIRFTIAE